MRLPRFTIRSLLGGVVFVAIGVASLRAADEVWDGCLLGLTSLCLLTAILLAVHRTDRRRAFWLGFALFGWAYLIASLIPPVGARLPTTRGLAFLNSKIPGRETTVAAVFGYTNTAGTYTDLTLVSPYFSTPVSSTYQLWDATTGKLLTGPGDTTESFVRIGHLILALVLGFFGGHLSRYLYGRSREEKSQTSFSPAAPA